MESTVEFEMMHNGNLELFEAFFTWEAWQDCFDPSDSDSTFWEWSHVLIRLSYLTEDGDTIKLLPRDYQALLPELKDFVQYNINAQIENEIY
jgi:hypothetical protein